jgi:hypothetical protein
MFSNFFFLELILSPLLSIMTSFINLLLSLFPSLLFLGDFLGEDIFLLSRVVFNLDSSFPFFSSSFISISIFSLKILPLFSLEIISFFSSFFFTFFSF